MLGNKTEQGGTEHLQMLYYLAQWTLQIQETVPT